MRMDPNNWLTGLLTSPQMKSKKNREVSYRPLLDVCWSAHAFASDVGEAIALLKSVEDQAFIEVKIMISGLEACQGNRKRFEDLLKSRLANHPLTRSFKWVLALPKIPKISFDRFNVFDEAVRIVGTSRPFYEFGVWNGYSFKYLINGCKFKKGFGFDTFTGLPEAWGEVQPKGGLSAQGIVPKIEGGEFIVGDFKDTLPKFFSEERPKAGLINFDADLYSSTLCALTHVQKVIDKKTILIFDEFFDVIDREWELDECRALKEFCEKFNFKYEVVMVSFFSKQLAIRLL